jgi:hypothetical protein
MGRIDVVIPYAPTPERDRVLRWVVAKWNANERVRNVIISRGDDPDAPWSKGRLVRDGVLSAETDIVAVADADCFVWSDWFELAASHVNSGAHRWAVPHSRVARLTADATRSVLQGDVSIMNGPFERVHPCHPGGGAVILNRSCMVESGCFPDPRFIGWGQEDDAWGRALRVLHGVPWRPDTTVPRLFHLWHPPAPRLSPGAGSVEGMALNDRYVMAADRYDSGGGSDEMRRLVGEGWA